MTDSENAGTEVAATAITIISKSFLVLIFSVILNFVLDFRL